MAAAVVLAAALLLVLATARADGAPTGGASPAPTSMCREVTCSASLAVGSRIVHWTSPELFFPANEQVLAKFRAGKAEATLLKSYGAELCKHRFFGAAMSILVKSCGPQAEIVVRAVRLKRGLRRLTITYAADAYDTGESGVSGKRSSGIYGGLIPLTGLTWD